MRITSQMGSSQIMANMASTLDRAYRLQNQISSGKRILSSTDDPVGTNQALSLRSSLAGVEQYLRNADQATTQFKLIDSSLGNINTALQQAKNLGLTGANAATSDEQRQVLATQVQQHIDNIVKAVNTTHLNRYIYGGNKTTTIPVTASTGTPPYQYNGDDGQMMTQVSDSLTLGTSLTARQVLNFDGATDPSLPDVLSVLKDLQSALQSGNTDAITKSLDQIDKSSQNVIALRGQMGARAQQLQMHTNYLEDTQGALKDWLSQVEDVDVAQAITDLQAEMNVYQASLIASARTNQMSLADYLK